MAIRYVSIDFLTDFGGEEPRIFIRNLDQADTVIAKFTAPPDDPRLRLGITHTPPGMAIQRRAILTDEGGKVVLDHQAAYYDWRMYTKAPPARGYNIPLEGGREYTVTVTTNTPQPGKRADFFFSVGS